MNATTEEKPRLFHYTTVSRLRLILSDGFIAPATKYVNRNERPAVWCSFNQHWEPTATPAYQEPSGAVRNLTFDELAGIDTPARIEVDHRAAPMDFATWRIKSGVSRAIAEGLFSAGIEAGADVRDWRAGFKPIKVSANQWLAVELFLGGRWEGQ